MSLLIILCSVSFGGEFWVPNFSPYHVLYFHAFLTFYSFLNYQLSWSLLFRMLDFSLRSTSIIWEQFGLFQFLFLSFFSQSKSTLILGLISPHYFFLLLYRMFHVLWEFSNLAGRNCTQSLPCMNRRYCSYWLFRAHKRVVISTYLKVKGTSLQISEIQCVGVSSPLLCPVNSTTAALLSLLCFCNLGECQDPSSPGLTQKTFLQFSKLEQK
jgi:hypothetical protein